MSEELYLATICLPLATVPLVFGMRYLSAASQAKTRLAHDGAYRQIAATAVTAQSETAFALTSLQTATAQIGNRLASIEAILKQVE